MRRMQGETVICRECGSPFWGTMYTVQCPRCRRETKEKAKPSGGVRLGAGFAIRSKSDNWKKRGRPAVIMPLPPIKDVVEGYQPQRKPYPGRVYISTLEKSSKEYTIIEVGPGKPLVLHRGEYREVERDGSGLE